MKLFFTTSLLIGALAAAAQPKTVSQAVIATTTTISAPDTEEPSVPQPSAEGGPVVIRRSMLDAGETKSVTYFKNNMVKTVVENDMGRNTTIRDNDAKKTTTLMEIMGNKRGFYATDEEQEEMRKKMDSMMQVRNDGQAQAPAALVSFDIAYSQESKKIAGYVCKKAVVIYTRANGSKDSTVAWYNTEIALKGLRYTGGPGGGFISIRRSSSQDGLDKIEGFVMQYESTMARGRKMTVTVTKLDIEKEIKDKEFEISKDFDLKPMKDMQGPGGGMQIRIGGPGGGSH
jgi:GLPGLI family protein